MEAADKRVKETNHPLAVLYRSLLYEADIGIVKWDKLTMRYYRSPYSRIKKNATDIASDKNNFYRSLGAPTMTWKNFFKALCIMSPISIEFSIKLNFFNKKTVEATFFTKNPMPLWDEDMPIVPIDHTTRRSKRRGQKPPKVVLDNYLYPEQEVVIPYTADKEV
jgi:hypothetical protein